MSRAAAGRTGTNRALQESMGSFDAGNCIGEAVAGRHVQFSCPF